MYVYICMYIYIIYMLKIYVHSFCILQFLVDIGCSSCVLYYCICKNAIKMILSALHCQICLCCNACGYMRMCTNKIKSP